MKFLRAIATGLAAGIVLFGLACGEPVGPPKQVLPAAMQIQGGNAQTATVAQPLPAALEVRIVDSDGNPMSGIAVTWSVTSGGGNVAAESPATGSGGTVRAAWTLGSTSGSQSVTAKAGGLTQVFTATANPDRPAVITATPDSLLLDAIGDSSRASFVVADQHGNVHATATLAYALGAAVDSTITKVDAAGYLHARGPGRALVTVTADTARLVLPVRVAPVIAALRLGTAPACLASVGDTVRLAATAEDRNAHAVADAQLRWSVRDTAVVAVDSAGLVRARANGSAWVLVTGTNARGERADSVQVCVTQAVAQVEVTPALDTLHAIGATTGLAAVARDARGSIVTGVTFSWTSLDTAIATTSATFGDSVAVTAVTAGTARIVVASGSASDTATVVVEWGCRDLAHAIGDSLGQAWTAGDCRDDANAAVDRYVLTLGTQEHFRATVDGAAGRRLRLRRGSSTGEYIGFMPRALEAAPTTNPASVDYLLAPGTYVLEVSAPDSATLGSYTLRTTRLNGISCEALTWATPGVEITGTVGEGDCVFNGAFEDFLLVHLPVGKRLHATLSSTGFGPVIAIKDDRSADAPLLSREYRATAGEVETSWTTEYEGSHEVIVTTYAPGATGAYTLRVNEIDAANSCVITPARLGTVTDARWETTDCARNDGKVHDRYSFADSTGLTAFRANLFGPAGKVLEAWTGGEWIAGNLPGDTAVVRMHFFLRPGSVELRPVSPDAGGQDYRLSTIADTNITSCRNVWTQPGAVIPGQTLSATDCSFNGSYEDRLLVRLVAGTTFNVEMTSSEFAPAVYLRDAAATPGTILVGDVLDAPGTGRLSWAVTTTGVYELIASSSVDGATGAYTLVMPDSLSELPVAAVVITPDSVTLAAGDTLTLVAAAQDADGGTLPGRSFTWASSDTTLATVDVAGMVTARAAGQVAIIATTEGISDTATVTITPRPITSLVLSADTLELAARDTASLTAALADDKGAPVATGAISWSSRDTTIASVSDSGLVTGVAEGTTWITATSGSAVDSAIVIVGPVPVARVLIAPDSAVVYLGATTTFIATTTAAAGDTLTGRAITWATLDTATVSVDSVGVVTPKVLGRARVIATSTEGWADTAIVNVRSPISRIVITPDTLTLTAVGQTQSYLAAAYDTLDAPMAGVTFTWQSANPLVATVSPSSGGSTTATAEGSGVTQITATAMGQVGMASLRVGQYAATIDASPDTVRIAVGGLATLSAIARDGNAAEMPDAAIRWKAANAFATVDSVTGQVRGQTLGVGKVVARVYNPSDTVVSDTVVVVVANDAPPRLTIGANSFNVGRFASVSVPLYLSTAPTQAVTVLLRTADTTIAKFSSVSVTFNAGQTQSNASITGVLPGSVAFYATDSAGTYGADTARVQVQINATVNFPGIDLWNWKYREMNLGERYEGTVQISDPAPVGGLYFTVDGGSYVTPEPATVYIPAGQLAAGVTITGSQVSNAPVTVRALASGTTAAEFPVTVHPRRFRLAHTSGTPRTYTIGRGQRSDVLGYNVVVTPPSRPQNDVALVTTVADPAVLAAPASILFKADSARYPLRLDASATGTTTMSMAGGDWVSDTATIIVTTPVVKLSNSSYGAETYVGVGRGSMYASLADSVGDSHAAIDTVRFRFWSGDTTVVKVESDSGVILPGTYMPPGQYLYMQAVGGGSTYIYTGADGYLTDSIAINVRVPKISATGYSNAVKARATPGYLTQGSISISAARPQGTLWFQLQSSDTMVVAFDSVEASYYGSTPQSTTSATARSYQAGTATVIVSAPGYEPDTIEVVSAQGRVSISGNMNYSRGYELQMFQEGARIWATAQDSIGYLNAWDTTDVTFEVLDTTVVRMDSLVARKAPGEQLGVSLPVEAVNIGETKIIATAPGLKPDTIPVYVRGVQLTIGGYRNQLATNQANLTGYTVNIPTARSEPVVVHLETRHPEIATLTADSVIIPAGQRSATFGWSSGSTLGKDTIFISSTGYAPDTLAIEVRTPKILPGGFYGTGSVVRTTQQGQAAQFGLGVDNDVNSVGHTTIPVTIYVASSDSSVMVPDSAAIHFQPGETYRQLPLRFINPGTAYLIYRDSAGAYIPDSTNNITVVAPEVTIRSVGYDRLKLGMGQQSADSSVASSGAIQAGYFVTVADPVAGAPLVIDLVSSDTSVVKLSASQVTIPVGGTMAFVRITAQDTTGSIAVYATADGFLQGRLDVDVTQPALYVGVPGTTSLPMDTTYRGYLYIGARAQVNGSDNAVSEDLVLNLSSSDPTVVSLDQTTVTIPAGQRYLNLQIIRFRKAGTVTITATDPRSGFTTYLPGTSATLTVTSP